MELVYLWSNTSQDGNMAPPLLVRKAPSTPASVEELFRGKVTLQGIAVFVTLANSNISDVTISSSFPRILLSFLD